MNNANGRVADPTPSKFPGSLALIVPIIVGAVIGYFGGTSAQRHNVQVSRVAEYDLLPLPSYENVVEMLKTASPDELRLKTKQLLRERTLLSSAAAVTCAERLGERSLLIASGKQLIQASLAERVRVVALDRMLPFRKGQREQLQRWHVQLASATQPEPLVLIAEEIDRCSWLKALGTGEFPLKPWLVTLSNSYSTAH